MSKLLIENGVDLGAEATVASNTGKLGSFSKGLVIASLTAASVATVLAAPAASNAAQIENNPTLTLDQLKAAALAHLIEIKFTTAEFKISSKISQRVTLVDQKMELSGPKLNDDELRLLYVMVINY